MGHCPIGMGVAIVVKARRALSFEDDQKTRWHGNNGGGRSSLSWLVSAMPSVWEICGDSRSCVIAAVEVGLQPPWYLLQNAHRPRHEFCRAIPTTYH